MDPISKYETFPPLIPVLGYDGKIQGAGLRIEAVAKGGPAQRAGLRKDDVLTELDGHPVRDHRDLKEELVKHRPGDSVGVKFTRDGSVHEQMITIGRAKDNAQISELIPIIRVGPPKLE